MFESIPGTLFPHKNRDKMCNASLTITAGTSYVYVESKSSPALEKKPTKVTAGDEGISTYGESFVLLSWEKQLRRENT